jgi:hypothetical protein
VLPYLGILFVESGYHQKYTELTLPQLLGLSSVPDFPATVAPSSALSSRLVQLMRPGGSRRGASSGGWSIIKQLRTRSLAPVAAGRRAARAPAFAIGLAPAVLTLAL